MPKGIDWKIINDDYRWLKIYENTNYCPLITTYSKAIDMNECINNNSCRDILSDTVICSSQDFEEIKNLVKNSNSNLNYVIYSTTKLFASLHSDTDGFAVMDPVR